MEYYQRVLLAALTPAVAVCVQAQVTTSSLGGQILNESNQPVAGVVVKATHVPSGTTYSAVTNANGRYTIQGMRPGGPYTVAIHYLGYNAEKFENINLELGNMFPLDASLSPNLLTWAKQRLWPIARHVREQARTSRCKKCRTSQRLIVQWQAL